MLHWPAAWLLAALPWLRPACAVTSPNIITTISPISISQGSTTTVTIVGSTTGQKGDFVATGFCGFANLNTGGTELSGGVIIYFASTTGTFDLCFRDVGEVDSIAQTSVSLTVVAATDATVVTAISPTTVSNGVTTTITLTSGGSLAGYLAVITTTGDCALATPSVDVSSGSIAFTPPGTGVYDLCMQASGGSDSVPQTGITITVQAATASNLVTWAAPNGFTATVEDTVVLTFATPPSYGDLLDFVLTGNCSLITPSMDATQDNFTITLNTVGTYDICYTAADGTDSIAQTSITLTVSPVPAAGGDPVAFYNGKKVDFALPPGKFVPLLRSPDVTLYGMTFEGQGPWEQWFGRMVAASPDGQSWVEVAVRGDLLSFNRSAQPRSAFESLEVTLGRGDLERPEAMSRLPGLEVPVPISFLGSQVLFRKMHRHYSTAFTTIGRARRECMDFLGSHLHFFVCASAASEYYGSPDRHLAIKFAHLNFVLVEAHNVKAAEGLLPELWGLRPMSEETAGYISQGAAKNGEQFAGERIKDLAGSTESSEPLFKDQLPPLKKGMAWAGGADPEDLKRSCAEQNTSFAESNDTFNI